MHISWFACRGSDEVIFAPGRRLRLPVIYLTRPKSSRIHQRDGCAANTPFPRHAIAKWAKVRAPVLCHGACALR